MGGYVLVLLKYGGSQLEIWAGGSGFKKRWKVLHFVVEDKERTC